MRKQDNLRVEERFAINSLSQTYAFALDRRDGNLFAAQFMSDGKMVISDRMNVSGIDRLRIGHSELAEVASGLARYSSTMHVLGQHTVEFLGIESARGEGYCVAYHFNDSKKGCFTMYVRYLDTFRRVAGKWLIEERHLICEGVSGSAFSIPVPW